MSACQKRLDRHRFLCREKAVRRIGIGAIDDDLAMIGLLEAFIAGLMTGDEPVGVDHLGESVGRLGRGIAAQVRA